jgi:hypothetical protein
MTMISDEFMRRMMATTQSHSILILRIGPQINMCDCQCSQYPGSDRAGKVYSAETTVNQNGYF